MYNKQTLNMKIEKEELETVQCYKCLESKITQKEKRDGYKDKNSTCKTKNKSLFTVNIVNLKTRITLI